jgi:hypothetical protein
MQNFSKITQCYTPTLSTKKHQIRLQTPTNYFLAQKEACAFPFVASFLLFSFVYYFYFCFLWGVKIEFKKPLRFKVVENRICVFKFRKRVLCRSVGWPVAFVNRDTKAVFFLLRKGRSRREEESRLIGMFALMFGVNLIDLDVGRLFCWGVFCASRDFNN